MIKLSTSILLSISLVMMMMYWGGYGSIVNDSDSDYDISTTTTFPRQLSSLQGYMDPKSTNLRKEILDDIGCISRKNKLVYVRIPKTG